MNASHIKQLHVNDIYLQIRNEHYGAAGVHGYKIVTLTDNKISLERQGDIHVKHSVTYELDWFTRMVYRSEYRLYRLNLDNVITNKHDRVQDIQRREILSKNIPVDDIAELISSKLLPGEDRIIARQMKQLIKETLIHEYKKNHN